MRVPAVGGAFALLLTSPAIAAPPPPTPASDAAAVTSYGAAFFARTQPSSAFEMVQLLPGFRLIEGDADLRGYAGAAGNVLLDGHPLTSKEASLEDLLKGISAREIERIDVIRGASAGFDMQGHSVLANVVRRPSTRLSGRVEGEYANFSHGLSAPRAAVNISMRSGARTLDVQAAAYREIDDEHGFGSRNRYAAGGAPLRIVTYSQPEGARISETSFAYGQPLADGDLRVTGLVKDQRMFADIEQDILIPRPALAEGSERKHTMSGEGLARYDRALGKASRLEVLISRRETRVRGAEASFDTSGSELSRAASDAAETIARGLFRRKGEASSMEVGAEATLNTFVSRAALFENDVEVPLPAANVRIEEQRGEAFANGSWQPSSRVTLEAGLRFEASRLTQSGDSQLSRTFTALKPRALARYVPGPRDEIRLLIEREVGQLDFGDFVSDASVTSDAITAGNRDLQPESLWRAELAWERHIGAGSIVLTGRHEWVSHLVDRIAVVSPEGVFDSVGNIGRARRSELEGDANLPLDGVAWRGLTVRASGLIRDTRALDPLTHDHRRISGEAAFEGRVAVTQDLPARRLRFGAAYVAGVRETKFKIDEVEEDRLGARLDAWIEFKPDARWTLRAFAKNLTDSPATRARDVYGGLRPSTAFRFREVRVLRSGRYFGLKVQREFGG